MLKETKTEIIEYTQIITRKELICECGQYLGTHETYHTRDSLNDDDAVDNDIEGHLFCWKCGKSLYE